MLVSRSSFLPGSSHVLSVLLTIISLSSMAGCRHGKTPDLWFVGRVESWSVDLFWEFCPGAFCIALTAVPIGGLPSSLAVAAAVVCPGHRLSV